MVKIEIVESLVLEIKKKFTRAEANEILDLIGTLADNPQKGKTLGTVGGILIKEIKYKKFRFYFIVDGYKLKFLRAEDLTDLMLRFVRMSDKKHQEQAIQEIRRILVDIGLGGF